LEAAARKFAEAGWSIEIVDTQRKGDAQRLARKAALSGSSVVFACGGDGTANDVANGLAATESAMSLIPAGLTNVFAREMGVPTEPEKALEALTNGRLRKVDVGTADGRRFLLQAGIGFDAEVIRSVTPAEKHTFGKAAFIAKGVKALFSRRAKKTELMVDGRPAEPNLFWLMLANSASYAGVKVAEDTAAEDGRLTSYLVEGEGPLTAVSSAASVLLNRASESDNVAVDKVEQIEVSTPGLPVHADGEDLGDTPMRFGVEPHALPLLVPKTEGEEGPSN